MDVLSRGISFLWRVAISPVTFVILALFWSLDLAVGSFVNYFDPNFGSMDAYPFAVWLDQLAPRLWPGSLWVYILTGLTWLMVASLVLCTANWLWRRKNALRAMGEFLIHLGFLLVFAGFMVGSSLGARTQGVQVPLGGTAVVQGFPFQLRLDGLELERFPNGQPRDLLSQVTLLDQGRILAQGVIRTNNPLIHGSTVIYPPEVEEQIAAGQAVPVGIFNVHRDPGVWLVILGAVILGLGTVWSLARYLGAIRVPPEA